MNTSYCTGTRSNVARERIDINDLSTKGHIVSHPEYDPEIENNFYNNNAHCYWDIYTTLDPVKSPMKLTFVEFQLHGDDNETEKQ